MDSNGTTRTLSVEYRRSLEAMYRYIQENLDGDLSADSVANVAGFSTFHFHRLFKALTNETLCNAIKRIRLETATKLMLAGDGKMNISAIALECGFHSSSAFSRAFSAHFGIPPSRWKKSRICQEAGLKNSYISSETYSSFEVRVETVAPIKVAYTSTLMGYDQEKVQESFWELYRWAESKGVVTPQTQFIGIGLDDPSVTPEHKCRYLNAVEVDSQLYDRGCEVSFMTIPGGSYAILAFTGRREKIPAAYSYLCGVWLPSTGYFPANSFAFEWYREAPKEDGTLRFDIYVPLI